MIDEKITKIQQGDTLYSLFGDKWEEIYNHRYNYFFKKMNTPIKIRQKSKIYVPQNTYVQQVSFYHKYQHLYEKWNNALTNRSINGQKKHIIIGMGKWVPLAVYLCYLILEHLQEEPVLVLDISTKFNCPFECISPGDFPLKKTLFFRKNKKLFYEQCRLDAEYVYKMKIKKMPGIFSLEYASIIDHFLMFENKTFYIPNGYVEVAGIIRKVCDKKKYNYICYENIGKNMVFCNNKPIDYKEINSIFLNILPMKLNKKQMKIVNKTLSTKTQAKRNQLSQGTKKTYTKRGFQYVDLKEELPSKIKDFYSKYKKIIILYDDIDYYESIMINKNVHFSNNKEWIKQTSYFCSTLKEDTGLIIREHPDADDLNWFNQIETKEKNSLFIRRSDKINSFKLVGIPNIKLLIVGFGWIAIDLLMFTNGRIPILSSKNSVYSNQTFITKPIDKKDYFNKIKELISCNFQGYDIDRIKKYYFSIIKYFSYYPGFDRFSPNKWTINNPPNLFKDFIR